ncbi:hypothetical protein EVAR_28939_1 [Eumeta japonica]|uniref:Uncharacterized protein n=1 Tax=Eumeta variegata TaxID=151549 RepID=A0A4C1W0T8_EUMVA|nr:hypothetical protein EVAR_28939_1 [Eumeta japonica]
MRLIEKTVSDGAIRHGSLAVWGFSAGSPSVTSSLSCRMLLNLAAHSSRVTCGRAEVSVDRGFWGAARSRLSEFTNRLAFPVSQN